MVPKVIRNHSPKNKNKYIGFKINQWGLALSLMRDKALSPLRYSGAGLFLNNNKYKFKPRTLVHRQWQIYSMTFTKATLYQSATHSLSLARIIAL